MQTGAPSCDCARAPASSYRLLPSWANGQNVRGCRRNIGAPHRLRGNSGTAECEVIEEPEKNRAPRWNWGARMKGQTRLEADTEAKTELPRSA